MYKTMENRFTTVENIFTTLENIFTTIENIPTVQQRGISFYNGDIITMV
jgi:hypothetical protein